MTDKKRVQTTKKQSKKSTEKSKQSKARKWIKRILWSILGVFILAVIAVVTVSAYFISSAPEVTQEQLVGTLPSTIYDKDGNVLSKLGNNERIFINPDNLPKNLEDALLSIEDRRFYDHDGVDFVRVAGAFLSNLKKGSIAQGGSTITQQLIKLSVFSTSTADQTIKRKIQEMWIASQLEKQYSKPEILSLYMNKVYLANNVYGFGTAAKYYYNQDVSELSIDRAALLAGMVQAPSYYDPYVNPEAVKDRRDTVLSAMVSNGKITQQQYDELSQIDVSQGLIDHSKDKSTEQLAIDSYVQVVLDELTTKTSLDPYKDGLEIYTNMDKNAQNQLVSILNTNQYINWKNADIQAAVTVTNPNTGGIIAMAGGRHINVRLGLNRATQAIRSVGSTSKPLVDYGPAIEYLNYSTNKAISDSPINYSDGTPLYNWDREYMGTITMRTALASSRNTTALRTLKEVGFDNALAFLSKFEFSKVSSPLYESNAIGFVASPLEMGIAYGAFSNGGMYYKPFTINKIITQSGESATYGPEGKRVMKDSTAYMITDILKGVPQIYATHASISGLYHAGKSGTTNYTDEQKNVVLGGKKLDNIAPDSWYVGYTKHYVVSSWVGYDMPNQQGNYLDSTMTTYAQRIYKNMMSYLMKGVQNINWERPSSVELYNGELYVAGSVKKVETVTAPETTTTSLSSVDESSVDSETSSTSSLSITTTRQATTTTTRQTTTRPVETVTTTKASE